MVFVYCAFLHSFVYLHHQHDYSDLAQQIGVEHYAHTLGFIFISLLLHYKKAWQQMENLKKKN